MKNLQRFFLASFVALLMPALCFAGFRDVGQSNPYFEAINYVQGKGIVQGYPDGSFAPWGTINRAEFVKILVGAQYSPEEITACKDSFFKDVPSDAWYASYVCVAKKNNIISGYPDGTFRGDASINFVEAAKILVNSLRSGMVAGQGAGDEWYMPYVEVLASLNAIPVEINFPDEAVVRGVTAEMIYRLKENDTSKFSLLADEVGDGKIIDDYYAKISSKDLEGAYALKIDPGMSLEAFKQMYADFPYSYVSRFYKVGRHTYSFLVRAVNISLNAMTVDKPDNLYLVEMEVTGGSLKTLSAEELASEVLEEEHFNADLKATIEWDKGLQQVYVYEGSEKILVAEYDRVGDFRTDVSGLYFSPQGKYLMYGIVGWEYGGVYLYDIANKVLSDS